MLFGAWMSSSSGAAAACPKRSPAIPIRAAKSIAVCTAAGSSSISFCPMRFAIKMFAPMDRPEDSVTIKAMISVFVPTAASAPSLPK